MLFPGDDFIEALDEAPDAEDEVTAGSFVQVFEFGGFSEFH